MPGKRKVPRHRFYKHYGQIPSMREQVKLGTILFLFFLVGKSYGQELEDFRLDFQTDNTTLNHFISQLNSQIPGIVYFPAAYGNITVNAERQTNVTLADLLKIVLNPHRLDVFFHRNSIAVIAPREDMIRQYTAKYYQVLEESIEASQNDGDKQIVLGSIDQIDLSGETQITGVVRDAETSEVVIGATLTLEDEQTGTATETDGSYSLSMKSGDYILVVQYVGYQVQRIPVKVISSDTLDIHLERSTVLLDEVLVQAKARDVNVQSTQIGVSRVTTKDIEKLPSFLGEVDIIKGLLLQPGVSTIGEGSSGFNVRGGNVDQNLIMIDEGMIFNASHALGFFSSFNSDIVSEGVLYKGTMPAIYGGRLASVLDVKVRDGSFERWHVKGGLGLVSSRINVDGPLSDRTSVLFSVRSTYSDWLLQRVKIPEVRNSSAFFYDFNFRLAHRFNEKNNLTISAYSTEDQFTYNNEFGFDYQTMMGQIQYRKVLGTKTLSTTNAVWSRYNSQQQNLDSTDASIYRTGLQYVKLKENINYLGDQFQANLGASAIYYQIDGNQIKPDSELSLTLPENLDDEKSIEWSLYADFDLEISPRLSLIGGLRYSIFNYLGPQNTFLYLDPSRPTVEGLLEPITLNDGIIKTYRHLQPRLSFRYNLAANSSVKGGYGRAAQYINQIYNSETPTPTSFWQLSNQYIQPQLAHNFSLGYFHNFSDNLWITSFEFFYRDIDQMFDYRGFADLLVNEHLETELLSGIGRAYGLELSVHRQVGVVHGWLNYTYSRSERKIDGINDGNWYPSNFDKPHDLTLITNFQINKRNSFSLNFTYGTGRPITAPVNKYLVHNRVVVLNYSERNAFRIPDYHRLDISYNLAQGFRKSKKFKTSWTFSIYNLYARRNPYSVFVEQGSIGPTKVKRLAVLGSAFPSLTFNFELL